MPDLMSDLMCNCNFIITNSDSLFPPATHKAFLVTDVDVEPFIFDALELSDLPKRQIIECPQCKRIWIEKEPKSNTFVSYLPEAEALDLAINQGGYRG